MCEETKMTLGEMTRLSDWLKTKGFSDKDVLDCIDYISDDEIPE